MGGSRAYIANENSLTVRGALRRRRQEWASAKKVYFCPPLIYRGLYCLIIPYSFKSRILLSAILTASLPANL